MVSIKQNLKFCCLVEGQPFPKQALVFSCLQYGLDYPRLQLSGALVMKIGNTRKFSGTTMLRWLPRNINRAQVSAAMDMIML